MVVKVFNFFFLCCNFVRPEDAERGLQVCQGKMFLGAEMDLQYWQGWGT